MRDPKRINRICSKLQKLWEKYPDWRLGQLIDNVTPSNPFEGPKDIFNIEDDAWERQMDDWLQK